MKEKSLEYSGAISTAYFYKTILSQIENLKKQYFKGCIVLDFTDVGQFESSVIPNLLILGDYIKDCTENRPLICIDESNTSGSLKRYLYQIGFFNLCEQKERFYLDCDKYTGWPEENKMDVLNTTVYFEVASSEELAESQKPEYPLLSKRIWNYIQDNLYTFSSKYLSSYQEFTEYNDIKSEMESNMALSMTHEIIKNSLIHGRSYSYVTFQINRSKKKIYLTLSDYGMGFYKNLKDKGIKVKDEGMAIIEGIFTRAMEEGYGLYDVVCRTLEQSGAVRIHSNNTKIVLTNISPDDNTKKIKKYVIEQDGFYPYLYYLEKKDVEGLAKKLQKHKGYNYIENLSFPGVHVEIVLPIEKNVGNV